jgi:hypothetical protein
MIGDAMKSTCGVAQANEFGSSVIYTTWLATANSFPGDLVRSNGNVEMTLDIAGLAARATLDAEFGHAN